MELLSGGEFDVDMVVFEGKMGCVYYLVSHLEKIEDQGLADEWVSGFEPMQINLKLRQTGVYWFVTAKAKW